MPMPALKVFIDTNILLYLLSSDLEKADQAESILQTGGLISVQVLNEITNVARRKLAMQWAEVNEFLGLIRSICQIAPLTLEVHDKGRAVAERYKLSIYDSMIVASAILGECDTVYSEDMQNGLLIDDQLQICNPFMT
jgi:predicted nucleic acid-binding protein